MAVTMLPSCVEDQGGPEEFGSAVAESETVALPKLPVNSCHFLQSQYTINSSPTINSSCISPTHQISERFRQIDNTRVEFGKIYSELTEVSEFDWFESMGYSYVRVADSFGWSIVCISLIAIGTQCACVNEPVFCLMYFVLSCGACIFNGSLASLGSHGGTSWKPLCAGVTAFLTTSLLTLFGLGFAFSFFIGYSLCILFAGIVAMRNAQPGNLPWRKRGAWCTVVTILALGAVLISYTAMSQTLPILDGFYLSLLVPSLEVLSMLYLKTSYHKHVFQVRRTQAQDFEPRRSNSTAGSAANPTIRGDQKLYLSILVADIQAAMEGIRFAALIGGVIRDPSSNAWVWAVLFQFFVDTSLRTMILQWMAGRLVEYVDSSSSNIKESRGVLYLIRWLAMPSSITFLFHDMKFTLGYPRFAILIVSLIARSWQMEKLDDGKEMSAALTAGGFMFLEEVLEDACVLLFQYYGAKWFTDWSLFKEYTEFCPEHPNQVVNNPSLHYVSMPHGHSALIVSHSIVAAYIGFCAIVGERWVIGLDVHYKGDDNTIWWCSSASC